MTNLAQRPFIELRAKQVKKELEKLQDQFRQAKFKHKTA